MTTSPITIVIPAYNRAHTLPRTLESVGAQTLAPARVILVDNNSSDSSLAVMREWAARQTEFDVKVLTETKPGACAARNRGLEAVETDFVMFFDSDDVMLPNHVRDFSAAVNAHPETDIFGRSILTESIDGRRRKLYFAAGWQPMFDHLFRGCLSTQRVVVRTSLIRRVGAWNENLEAWNDYELGVRLLLNSDRIRAIGGQPSVVTYQQTESLTGTSFSAHPERWEKALDTIEALFRSYGRDKMIKYVDCRRMILAARYRDEHQSSLSEKTDFTPLSAVSGCYDSLHLSDRLRGRVLSKPDADHLRLNLVYWHNRLFKRLTWVLAGLLYGRKG